MSQAQNLLLEMDNSFSGSPYQYQSHLALAKLYMDSLDYDNAIIQLEFIIDNASDESFRHIARLRIARIMVEQNQFDEALSLLDSISSVPKAYAPYYQSIKGDIYASQGLLDKAKSRSTPSSSAILVIILRTSSTHKIVIKMNQQ